MAKFSQTATKVSQMLEIAFDPSSTLEKRESATTNLLVLAKENAGMQQLFLLNISVELWKFWKIALVWFWFYWGGELLAKEGIFEKISSLLKRETTPSIVITCIRIVSALCKGNLQRVSNMTAVVIVNFCWKMAFFFSRQNQYYIFLEFPGYLINLTHLTTSKSVQPSTVSKLSSTLYQGWIWRKRRSLIGICVKVLYMLFYPLICFSFLYFFPTLHYFLCFNSKKITFDSSQS